MQNLTSPLKDLTRAHSVLNSCDKEFQLGSAWSYFELVIQKWDHMLSDATVEALRSEFQIEYHNKKSSLKLE